MKIKIQKKRQKNISFFLNNLSVFLKVAKLNHVCRKKNQLLIVKMENCFVKSARKWELSEKLFCDVSDGDEWSVYLNLSLQLFPSQFSNWIDRKLKSVFDLQHLLWLLLLLFTDNWSNFHHNHVGFHVLPLAQVLSINVKTISNCSNFNRNFHKPFLPITISTSLSKKVVTFSSSLLWWCVASKLTRYRWRNIKISSELLSIHES